MRWPGSATTNSASVHAPSTRRPSHARSPGRRSKNSGLNGCSWLVVVYAAQREIGGSGMRAFPVRLPSGARYWTVLDEDLAIVAVADSFLRQVRFGRDGAESTTRAYAGSIALFLRWCARSGRAWPAGIEQLGL